jgi:hypothetical protein
MQMLGYRAVRTMVDCKISVMVSAGISRSIWNRLADRLACAIVRKTAALLEVAAAVMIVPF